MMVEPTAQVNEASLKSQLQELLNKDVVAVTRLQGGGNGRVFSVHCEKGEQFIAKHYFRDSTDARDRLRNEFNSLQFLRNQGVRNTPEPVAASPENGFAVYEFIAGEPIDMKALTSSDFESAVAFLQVLSGLRSVPESQDLPPASEACFSIKAIVENLDRRLARFQKAGAPAQYRTALHEFLSVHFKPSLGKIVSWCQRNASGSAISFDEEIPSAARTLSPSDFGFHNAVRRADGSIVFVDFEYFGWDDPAKTAADFMLHPGMQLDSAQQNQFWIRFRSSFKEIPELAHRLKLVRPLFALKWCLILLNEFLPSDLQRRRFAGLTTAEYESRLAQQLQKACEMLMRARKACSASESTVPEADFAAI